MEFIAVAVPVLVQAAAVAFSIGVAILWAGIATGRI